LLKNVFLHQTIYKMKKVIFILFAITLLSSCVVNRNACPGVAEDNQVNTYS